jgi:hypothetical protein
VTIRPVYFQQIGGNNGMYGTHNDNDVIRIRGTKYCSSDFT